MSLFSKKPMGLEFAPLLTGYKDNPETLISAAGAWAIMKSREASKPTTPTIYRDTEGRVLEWSNPVDKQKIILQMARASTHAEEQIQRVENGLCSKCEKPITGVLKKANTNMDVNFGTYMYLQIYSRTGLCIECIEEFLKSMMEKK